MRDATQVINVGAQNLFQLLNCFSTKLSQFLAGVDGAEAAQWGKVSSGAAVKAVWCAHQLQVSLLHVNPLCRVSLGTFPGYFRDSSRCSRTLQLYAVASFSALYSRRVFFLVTVTTWLGGTGYICSGSVLLQFILLRGGEQDWLKRGNQWTASCSPHRWSLGLKPMLHVDGTKNVAHDWSKCVHITDKMTKQTLSF